MRTIQSFILRLLIDADQHDTLRGVLRCVSDDTEQAFADETALIHLLRHWVDRSASPSITKSSTGDSHDA